MGRDQSQLEVIRSESLKTKKPSQTRGGFFDSQFTILHLQSKLAIHNSPLAIAIRNFRITIHKIAPAREVAPNDIGEFWCFDVAQARQLDE